MKKYTLVLALIMLVLLSGCDESDDKDFLETSAYENYMTTYWGNDKLVDYNIQSYRMEYSLPMYLSGNEESFYNNLEEIQEWLRINDKIAIKNLIPYWNENGNITGFSVVFKPDTVAHNYKIALNNYNLNVGNYVASMFVGNEKSDGYYFIIYDKIDVNTQEEVNVETIENSKIVNEEIVEDNNDEEVINQNTENVEESNVN